MSPRHALVAAALALGALSAFPRASAAQELPPAVQEIVAQMQEIEARLSRIQEQAMQDSAIVAQQNAITQAVRQAMIAADPATAEKLDRFDSLIADLRSAEASGDAAAVASLTAQALELQPQLMAAQQAVMSRPDIEARMEAFFDAVEARMIELDPETPALIERLNQLNDQAIAIMEGAR